MATKTLFISGTDTGVGKTWISCLIIRHLRSQGIDAVGFKPVCCGDRGDVEALAEASGLSTLEDINPAWFEMPLAPMVAAERESRTVDRAAILNGFKALCSAHDYVIAEGAGGWEVPLSKTESLADLAVEFSAPVLVVAANRLGALNHTLLTCQAIEQRGLKCAGVLLSEIKTPDPEDLAAATNRKALQSLLPEVPIVSVSFQSEHPSREFLEILDQQSSSA